MAYHLPFYPTSCYYCYYIGLRGRLRLSIPLRRSSKLLLSGICTAYEKTRLSTPERRPLLSRNPSFMSTSISLRNLTCLDGSFCIIPVSVDFICKNRAHILKFIVFIIISYGYRICTSNPFLRWENYFPIIVVHTSY